MQPTNHPRRIWDRADWVALLVLSAATAITSGIVLTRTALTGVWEDDGVYLVTAKSLAEGTGYRRLDLPGEPYQTKYPPLYPLLLACIWRIAPDFPRHIPAMQVLNAIFGLGAGVISCWLMRRAWRLPPWLVLASAVITVCTRLWVEFGQYTMSEHLYTLLSMAALACLFLPSKADGLRGVPPWLSGFSSGAFAAGALLCRSIGVTVAVAVIAAWLLRRRWHPLIWATVLPLAAWVGWGAWKSHAHAANAAIPRSAALSYDLTAYSIWMPGDVGTIVRVTGLNAASAAWSLFTNAMKPPSEWMHRAARADAYLGDTRYVVFAALGIIAVVVLLAAGLVMTFRRGWPVHLYLVLYGAAMLAWPFLPDRLLVPLYPLLFAAMLHGTSALFGAVSRLFAAPAADRPVAHAPRERILIPPRWADRLLLVAVLLLALHLIRFDYLALSMPEIAQGNDYRQAALSLIRDRTQRGDIIAGCKRGYFFLTSGRQFVPYFPIDDPVALFYPPDRSFWGGGRRATPGEAEALDRILEDQVMDYYRAADVRYVLLGDDGGLEARSFGRFCAQRADQLQVVADAGPYRLWRVLRGTYPFN